MIRLSPQFVFPFAALLGLTALGCDSGGIGDPCVPEDEYQQSFNGFAETEVNVESKSFQCVTRVCIVNHFQGRVSCPYGQREADLMLDPADPKRCRVPGTNGKKCLNVNEQVDCTPATANTPANIDAIQVPVAPQLLDRTANDTVYCSCRCKGPDPNANYCECPSGYECSELVKELGLPGRAQLAGSYCIKQGTAYRVNKPPTGECNATQANWQYGGDSLVAPAGGSVEPETLVSNICGARCAPGCSANDPNGAANP
jgi:hypothetical protein